MKQEIVTKEAPAAIGPYSQGIRIGDLVFVSGQLPIDSQNGEFAGDDILLQTKKSLENIKAILNKVGLDMKHIIKTTVYLNDMNDFKSMNEIYAQFFNHPFPARVAFEVAKLPKNALVEIEAIAYYQNK
ncbi:reactive intermediate/imine deaminase [Alkalibaculum sp. M08DMB]|uniref:Reactive intermediate/imine deaminase n=1 Tax=Alkalibaculum sporogenes TaxID=2655001 RepID=A0A6A7KAB2_9FIRM|nr:RidA family protein [Alkalibaculum sporogenes]MPW26127.1 reactive intermediate/imine deaminase [Alkalibaculum sporogenes]